MRLWPLGNQPYLLKAPTLCLEAPTPMAPTPIWFLDDSDPLNLQPYLIQGTNLEFRMLALCFWYTGICYRCCTWWQHPWHGSPFEENKEYAGTPFKRCVHAGMSYINCIHTRRIPIHWVRTPNAHSSRQLSAPTWGFLMIFSRRYCVIMVLARGIVYFIIIIEPHDPWFEEELAYIKQRRSFGLCMFLVE